MSHLRRFVASGSRPPASIQDADWSPVRCTPEADHPFHPLDEQGYVAHGGDPDRFVGRDGKPSLHLVLCCDIVGEPVLRLCEESTDLLVSPSDERLSGMGIHVAELHDEWSHKAACRMGDLRPGSRLRMVPAPFAHSYINTVAVYDVTRQHLIGYINKRQAPTLARLIHDGKTVEAVSIRGTKPGVECNAVAILAAFPEVLRYLLARSPGLPGPAPLLTHDRVSR
jgi:hypothetical protein